MCLFPICYYNLGQIFQTDKFGFDVNVMNKTVIVITIKIIVVVRIKFVGILRQIDKKGVNLKKKNPGSTFVPSNLYIYRYILIFEK